MRSVLEIWSLRCILKLPAKIVKICLIIHLGGIHLRIEGNLEQKQEKGWNWGHGSQRCSYLRTAGVIPKLNGKGSCRELRKEKVRLERRVCHSVPETRGPCPEGWTHSPGGRAAHRSWGPGTGEKETLLVQRARSSLSATVTLQTECRVPWVLFRFYFSFKWRASAQLTLIGIRHRKSRLIIYFTSKERVRIPPHLMFPACTHQ